MAEQDIQSRLNKLTHSQNPKNFGQRQVELVYWYCKFAPGESELALRRKVAKYMGVWSETTVWNSLDNVCEKLEIADLRFTPDEVCKALLPQIEKLPGVSREVPVEIGTDNKEMEFIIVPDFSKLSWPPDAITQVLDQEESRRQSPQSNVSDETPEAQPLLNRRWLTVFLPILLLFGLSLVGLNRLRNRNQLPPDPQATVDLAITQTVAAMSPVVETQIVEQPVEVPVTPEPDEIAILVQGTLETLPTQTPALATVLVPTIVVETVLATSLVPVTVEVTPAPTATPTETPLPQTVEIIEDFEDFILDPAFTVEGEPQFIEGRMNVGDRVTISIGDETWKNYSVSFDVDSLGYGTSIQMTIRDNRTSKLRYIQDNPYWWSGGWQYLNNSGEFVTIIDSGVGWQPRVELVVEDNFLYHTGPDGGTKTISNTYSDSGGFSLTLGVMWLDNLVVTRND